MAPFHPPLPCLIPFNIPHVPLSQYSVAEWKILLDDLSSLHLVLNPLRRHLYADPGNPSADCRHCAFFTYGGIYMWDPFPRPQNTPNLN